LGLTTPALYVRDAPLLDVLGLVVGQTNERRVESARRVLRTEGAPDVRRLVLAQSRDGVDPHQVFGMALEARAWDAGAVSAMAQCQLVGVHLRALGHVHIEGLPVA